MTILHSNIVPTVGSNILQSIFGEEFKLLNTGYASGEENMAFDELCVHQVENQISPPIFRLYGWNPWAVSLGYHQTLEHISLNECKLRSIDVVKRPTGGRAVLHAGEVTYSIITRCDNAQQLYASIHGLLLEALKYYSPFLSFEKHQPDLRKLYTDNSTVNKICFTSAARYELQIDGRKLVGSAQRLYKNILLQHGSILLNNSHENIVELFNNISENTRDQEKKKLHERSISLEEITGTHVSWDSCVSQITSYVYSQV